MESPETEGEPTTTDIDCQAASSSCVVPFHNDNNNCADDFRPPTKGGLKRHSKKAKLNAASNHNPSAGAAAAVKSNDAKFMEQRTYRLQGFVFTEKVTKILSRRTDASSVE
jgi:hypothetical protein